MSNINERLTNLRENALKNVDEYTKAICNNDFRAMNDLDLKLKDIEKEYIRVKSKAVYEECLASDNPVWEAISRLTYKVIAHKDVKENGVLIRRELNVDKEREIDLLDLCKYSIQSKNAKQLDTKWEYPVMSLNQMFCLRSAQALGFSPNETKAIETTYFMSQLAKRVEVGETPVSNTQLCKTLQSVIDGILFLDDGKGKNTYKANSRDIEYILMCYTKQGKKALSVQVAKHDFMRRLVTKVMYRIVTDGKYTLDYKKIKENA